MKWTFEASPREVDIIIHTLAMANTDAVADDIDGDPDEVKQAVISVRTRLENQR
jgi:hypothetical protein